MGCLGITITRVGSASASAGRMGDLTAIAERQEHMTAEVERYGEMLCTAQRAMDFSVRIGLVCGTNLGQYGIIWASDGKLITLENGYLIQA